MRYINTRTSYGIETVDEFDTLKEAREMLTEYRISSQDMELYLSTRCTKAWGEEK